MHEPPYVYLNSNILIQLMIILIHLHLRTKDQKDNGLIHSLVTYCQRHVIKMCY